ncbi:MAG: excinuclease ABC subunit UvrC [Firmicutes bacterium]|nr:excinuclease ABC subunit UvrC [Bacillota bacterium]
MNILDKLSRVPESPGVYLMKDEFQKVIYVGKALSLKNRLRSYFKESRELLPRTQAMIEKIRDFDYILTDSEVEALILEYNLIKKYRPYYNVRYRDDKMYPFMEITTPESFPRMKVVRHLRMKGSRLFGPYTSALAIRQTLKLMMKIFRLRTCNLKLPGRLYRPCIYYYIKQCTAPCAAYISEEEYRVHAQKACDFLEGHSSKILKELTQEMAKEAEALNFEKCARLRNIIQALEKVREKQKIIFSKPVDFDSIAFAEKNSWIACQVLQVREGILSGDKHFILQMPVNLPFSEKVESILQNYYGEGTYIPPNVVLQEKIDNKESVERWLSKIGDRKVNLLSPSKGKLREVSLMTYKNAAMHLENLTRELEKPREDEAMMEIKDFLLLPEIPLKIEAYDISNLMGKEAVGSMVYFEGGKPVKDSYRKYKIRVKETPDDYAMMKELLSRRLKDTNTIPLPGLLLIDGGKGQLESALKAASELFIKDINIAAIAKKEETIFIPCRKSPVILPPGSKGLYLLMRIRDEAHRFALSYHRKLRKKSLTKSILDDIAGIGAKRKKVLINFFGSVEKLKKAGIDEIAKTPGISRKLAGEIHNVLAKD